MSSFEQIPDRLDGVSVSPRALALWYAFAFVTYVIAATFEKGLLNWITGPAWLVGVVTFGPRWSGRRSTGQPSSAPRGSDDR